MNLLKLIPAFLALPSFAATLIGNYPQSIPNENLAAVNNNVSNGFILPAGIAYTLYSVTIEMLVYSTFTSVHLDLYGGTASGPTGASPSPSSIRVSLQAPIATRPRPTPSRHVPRHQCCLTTPGLDLDLLGRRKAGRSGAHRCSPDGSRSSVAVAPPPVQLARREAAGFAGRSTTGLWTLTPVGTARQSLSPAGTVLDGSLDREQTGNATYHQWAAWETNSNHSLSFASICGPQSRRSYAGSIFATWTRFLANSKVPVTFTFLPSNSLALS